MKNPSPLTDNQKTVVAYVFDRLRQIDTLSPDIESPLKILEGALHLERNVNKRLPLELQEKLKDFWEFEQHAKEEYENDKQLSEFIELLKIRGYFKDVEPDSEEYKVRMKKAINKYTAKQNPFADMTPEEIKTKGNAYMIAGKHDDAIRCYTKAIELSIESDNGSEAPSAQLHVYYANRAAAHIELKNYTQATEDCAKSISYKSDYPKVFARLGVAHYYLNEFDKSATAYERALELDKGNEKYRQDMQDARAKAKEVENSGPKKNPFQDFMGNGTGGNMMESMSSLLGDSSQMKDMLGSMGNLTGEGANLQSAMANMATNPQFMEMAQSFMKNPQFSNMVQGFAEDFMKGSGGANQPDFSSMQNLFDPTLAGMDSDAIRELRESEVASNPKMREIQEEVRQHGPGVFMKHMNDPDVMNLMSKFSSIIGKHKNSKAGEDTV